MLKKFAGVFTALLTISLAWAPAASAYYVVDGAQFNDPLSNFSTPYAVFDYVEAAIDGTPSGATILISTFLLDRSVSVDKLIAARDRGVHVQVVMDQRNVNSPSDRLMSVLNADNGPRTPTGDVDPGLDGSFAIKCVGSCRGDAGIVHTKFYAFSESGGVQNIVMVSSANLNTDSATSKWNDLYSMVDAGTYARYAAIHNEMADDTSRDLDSYQVYRTDNGRYESRFFPMLGASQATDPTMVDLSRVICSGASGGTGSNGHTAIHIAMFLWKGTRGLYIADRILNLARSGCAVKVIYGAPGTEVAAKLKTAARNGLIKLYDSRVDLNHDGSVDVRVHSKYMLIEGNYGPSPDGFYPANTAAWQVYTGSQNWSDGALARADELLLGIRDKRAYDSYLNNWRNIRNTGSRQIR